MAHQGQHHVGQATNHVDEYGNPVVVPGGGMGAHGVVGTGPAAGGHVQPTMGTKVEQKDRGILHRSGSSSSSSSDEDDGMGGRRKKGIKDKIKEKLPGGNKGQQATGGAYGQPGHTGVTGTGAHGTTAPAGTYGQQGHTGVTGTGAHGTTATGGAYGQPGHTGVTGTGVPGEKKGIMDKVKEKLPGGHADQQHTAATAAYGQQGHTGMTGTGTHGTTATGGAYGQPGHTGVAGTGTHPTGEKKGIMDKIKEKLPGQH